MLTSCALPSVMLIDVGISQWRSNSVCTLTTALCLRNFAQGKNERHRSIAIESPTYILCSRSTLIGSMACRGRVMRIKPCAKSTKKHQLWLSLVSANVDRATRPRNSHGVSLAARRAQACFYVSQTISVGQLDERHRQILVPVRETSQTVITAVARYAAAKVGFRQEAQQTESKRCGLDSPVAVASLRFDAWRHSNRGKLKLLATLR